MKPLKSTLLKRFFRNLVLVFFYVFRTFLRLLPFNAGLRFGGALGRLSFHALPYERRIALKNLREVFQDKSEKEINTLAKEAFVNLGMSLFEILNTDRIYKKFDDYVTIEGEDLLKKATAKKGCLCITGHVGNWELMGYYLAHRGFRIFPIARELYDTRLNDILVSLRRENGVETILRDKPDTSRKMLKALKDRCVLGMLIDQDTNVQGIFVDFFGKKAYTAIGPASIALKSGCDVITVFMYRQSFGHRLVITPLKTIDTADKQNDLYSNTLMYNRAVEAAIRKHPAQWVWMHKRWKTKPEDHKEKLVK